MANIKEALAKLDPSNDNHWTQDGLPRIETVRMFAADQTLTREAVTAADPNFSRASALQAAALAEQGASTPDGANATPASTQAVAQPEEQVTAPVQQDTPPDTLVVQQDAAEVLSGKLVYSQLSLEDLREMIRDAKQDVAEGHKYRNKVQAQVKAAERNLELLEAELEKRLPKESNTQAIQNYLSQQRKSLAERAEKTLAWKQADIDLRSIVPQKSPLDQAMARKPSRGTGRPVR